MSNELQVIDNTELTEKECATLDRNIEVLIESYKNNRQAVNRLVFESVAAMTEGDEYENQLKNKSGLSRFIGSITGSNKELQDKINSSRAAAQYASQQTLQKLAEQNLMSFDLITAVNNKLNASILNIEGEINNIYLGLTKFFKQQRSDLSQLENRIEKIERNVSLLNWQNTIEYQMFNDIEYSELDNLTKIICIISDFYNITRGQWTTSDLLLLKTAMINVDLYPKDKVNYLNFIEFISKDKILRNKLFGNKQIGEVETPENLLLVSGVKKIEALSNEEYPVVKTMYDMLEMNGVTTSEEQIKRNLLIKYFKGTCEIDINFDINSFDFILETLYNIREAQMEGIIDTDVKVSKLALVDSSLSNKDILNAEKFEQALNYFVTGEFFDAEELLNQLVEDEYKDSYPLLFWLYMDGYDLTDADEETAKEYLVKGYEAGNVIASILYGVFIEDNKKNKLRIFKKFKNKLEILANNDDVLAIYTLGIYYLNDTDEPKNYEKSIEFLKKAADKGFYRAYYGIALRYYYGEGVEKNLDIALEWASRAADFKEYLKPINLVADIMYQKENYDKALELYLKLSDKNWLANYERIAYMYNTGKGTEKNVKKAIEYYWLAVNNDNSNAACELGLIYEDGVDGQKNKEQATELYKKSACLGDGRGMCFYAWNLYHGYGIEKDIEQAEVWCKKALEEDYNLAYLLMGTIDNHYGRMTEALANFLEADTRGLKVDYDLIGKMYEKGIGTDVNFSEAYKWYKKSAEKNASAFSCYKIARMYYKGLGVEKSLSEAREWCEKALNYYGEYDKARRLLEKISEKSSDTDNDWARDLYGHYGTTDARYEEYDDDDDDDDDDYNDDYNDNDNDDYHYNGYDRVKLLASSIESNLLIYQWSLRENYNIFFAPDIPYKKLDGAITGYAQWVNEEDVVLLYDATIFGGADDGCIITKQGDIITHEMFGDTKIIHLDEVVKAGNRRNDIYVITKDGKEVELPMLLGDNTDGYQQTKKFAEMVEKLGEVVRDIKKL